MLPLSTFEEDTKKALRAAVNYIMVNEPGDSRAVSDIAVALAVVSCDLPDKTAALKIINDYLADIDKKMEERIVGVAFKYDGGMVALGLPNRHSDLFKMFQSERYGPSKEFLEKTFEQGFVTNFGEFKDRTESYIIAERAGQLLPRSERGYRGTELFSEDLW